MLVEIRVCTVPVGVFLIAAVFVSSAYAKGECVKENHSVPDQIRCVEGKVDTAIEKLDTAIVKLGDIERQIKELPSIPSLDHIQIQSVPEDMPFQRLCLRWDGNEHGGTANVLPCDKGAPHMRWNVK